MNREKLKSKKFVVPIAIVGILLTGASASLVLDIFGEVEGDGTVGQSVILTGDGETDGDISYTIDPLTAGDITNKIFSIENQADTPIPVEYENSVKITSDGTTYNSTNLDETDFTEMSEIVEIRVPKVINVVSETDTNIHTVESTDMDQSFQNFEEFVDTRNYVAYKVREEIDGVDFVVNIDNDGTTEQIEGNGSEGIHIVQLSQKDGIQSVIENNRGNSVESVDIELSGTTTGSFEMLDLVVQGESQYPESLALDNETISGETTVDRTQVSILNSYLQDGVNITLQTEVKPLGE